MNLAKYALCESVLAVEFPSTTVAVRSSSLLLVLIGLAFFLYNQGFIQTAGNLPSHCGGLVRI